MKSLIAHNNFYPHFTEERIQAGIESNLSRITHPLLRLLSVWLQSHRVTPEPPWSTQDRDLETPQGICSSEPGLTFVPGDGLRGSVCIGGSWPLWESHRIVSPFPRITYTQILICSFRINILVLGCSWGLFIVWFRKQERNNRNKCWKPSPTWRAIYS